MNNILYLGNKLSHHGFTKGVIETLGPQLESEGFSVTYSGTVRNQFLRLFQMLVAIVKFANKVDYVLIDTYSTSAFWYAWLSGMMCRILKVKYIPILHGGNLPERLRKSKWFADLLFKHSYANVAVSGYLKFAFDKSGYKSVLIPNNIDVSQYQFKKREILKPRLLWVRSFHKIYNPNMAADVLALLLKDFPDAELCMVGPDKDGSLDVFQSHCEKLGVAEKVKITGLMPKPEWHKLSEEYDVFINTTNIDNTPVSVIEAMALGLPVVSTNVDGIPYLLEDKIDSLLVNKASSGEMYQAIMSLLKGNIDANRIVLAARKKAESFDWVRIRSKWVNLLK